MLWRLVKLLLYHLVGRAGWLTVRSKKNFAVTLFSFTQYGHTCTFKLYGFPLQQFNSLVLCQYLLTVLFRRTTNGISRSKIAASRFYDHRHCRTKVSEKAKNCSGSGVLGEVYDIQIGIISVYL